MPVSHSIPKNAGFVSRLYLIESSVFPGALTGRLGAVALVLACLLVGLAPIQLHAQNVTLVPYIVTVAGTGTAGYNGDGGPAASSKIASPTGVAVDAAGNLYIVDENNNRIRKVNTSGIITTVAGSGTSGFSGDNGPATSAQLNFPYGIAVDNAGNLYIADDLNQVIRKVDASGTITTVAGIVGTSGYNGDNMVATSAKLNYPYGVAVDSAGNLYVADFFNSRIRKVDAATKVITTVAGNGTPTYGGDGGLATAAQINSPTGVAVDSAGNLYIADTSNARIRKVDAATKFITTVAGSSTAGYSGDGGPATAAQLHDPYAVAVDSAGNLYIADNYNARIRKVDASGIITTVAGNGTAGYNGDGGPATTTEFSGLLGVALDSAGNLYVADYYNNRVRKVVNGPVPFFNVPVGSSNSQLVRLSFNIKMTLSGNAQVTLGDYSPTLHGTCDPSVSAPTMCEWGVQFTPAMPGPRWGSFVVTDNGGTKYSFGLEGTGVGPAVAFTPGIISTVAGNGTPGYGGDGSAATGAEFNYPFGIALDGAGNIYIADWNNARIRVVNTQATTIAVANVNIGAGDIATVAGDGTAGYNGDNIAAIKAELWEPNDVAVDSAGNIYIADSFNERIRKVDVNGTITTVAGGAMVGGTVQGFSGDGGAATDAQLSNPHGVVVDSAGNLYIADTNNNRVRKVDTNGIINTIAGSATEGYTGDGSSATSATLACPNGVAVDSMGNFYIVDFCNNVVRAVNTQGTSITMAGVTIGPGDIATVAGTGTANATYSGDGGPASSAGVNYPLYVALDSAGNLYIADYDNNCVRKVDPSGIITTVAGNGSPGYSGDGGAATSANLYLASGIAVDGAGNLYITDEFSERIRKVDVSDPPSLTFPSTFVGTASAAQDVGIENLGNDTLNITQITTSANFTLQGGNNSCSSGQFLSPSLSCILGIEFMPSTAAAISSAVVLTDNALNGTPATQSILLNGTGTSPQPQTINFPNPGTQTYGVAPLTLNATASSGLPVSYAVTSGPAAVSGSTLTITGAGSVNVLATQGGGGSWLPATPVDVTINVNKAVLTVTANLFMGCSSVVPTLTASYSGFVNGDTSAVLSGAPALSTNAAACNGTYPITVSQGTLAAANYSFSFANGTLTVSPNALNLFNNYFVTGDYVASGTTTSMRGTGVGNYATGTITMASLPPGANVVAAFLYWQSLEDSATFPLGLFNSTALTGGPILVTPTPAYTYPVTTGQLLGNDIPYSDQGGNGQLRMYRADLLSYLSGGLPAGAYTVKLPDGGGALPQAFGASMVVVYRVLGQGPSGAMPLRAVVIYDGAWFNSTTPVTNIQGFYDAKPSGSPAANYTYLYSAGGNWQAPSPVTASLSAHSGAFSSSGPVGGALAAAILSTPVNSSDGDGLLDAWKATQGYYDAMDGSWVDLAGAASGQKDVFVQIDYMCSVVNADGTCDTTPTIGHSHLPSPAALQMVGDAFHAQHPPINVHFDVGNNFQDSPSPYIVPAPYAQGGNIIQEEACHDDSSVSPSRLCIFPDEPGVVPWTMGLIMAETGPRNAPCGTMTPTGPCVSRFPHGRKDSYHYMLSGHAVGAPSWGVQNTPTWGGFSISISGNGTNNVTVNVPSGHGLSAIPKPRVTIVGATSLPNLNGAYDPSIQNDTMFTLTNPNVNVSGTLDSTTDPNLAIVLGIPSWNFKNSELASISVSNNVATVTTLVPHGLSSASRVKVVGEITPLNGNGALLYGTYGYPVLAITDDYTFTITNPNSDPNAAWGTLTLTLLTSATDPDLAIYSGDVSTSSGMSDIGGAHSLMALGLWDAADAVRVTTQAGTLMHELGHSLGLTHSGYYYDTPGAPPTLEANCKPNYQSVMNYLFQVDLLGPVGSVAPPLNYVVDYSGQVLDTLTKDSTLSSVSELWASGTPTYLTTTWYAPTSDPTKAATRYCSGALVPLGTQMGRVSGADSQLTASQSTWPDTTDPQYFDLYGRLVPDQEPALAWSSGQNIDFDDNPSNVKLRGYNDWSNIDLRQVGATGLAFISGGYWGPGGGYWGPGGGYWGPGGGFWGPGGGFWGPGGGEMAYETANSSGVRLPILPTFTPAGTPPGASVTLTWQAPIFGDVQAYAVHRSDGVQVTLWGAPPPTTYTDTSPVAGTTYYVTSWVPGDNGVLRESAPSTTAILHSSSTVTVTCPASVTYNGTAQTPCSATVTGAGGLNQSLLVTYSSNTNGGTATASASFAGNADYTASSSLPTTFTINPAPVTATAGSYSGVYDGNSHPPSPCTVTGNSGNTYTGTLYCTNNPASVGPGVSSGTITPVVSGAGLSNFSITYNTAAFTIIQASTKTALSAAPNPSNFGQSVSMTATVAPGAPGAGTPTGNVTFLDGSLTLGTGTLSSGDTATFTTSSLAAGNHNLTASYGGDPNFSGSASSALAEQVVCGVLISLSPSTVPLGGKITVTGKVISCANTAQTIVVQFSLSGPLQPNSCSGTKSVMFTTPPFTLPAKTSQTVSFPFPISRKACTGTYSITATTLVKGTPVDTSTASLTITAH